MSAAAQAADSPAYGIVAVRKAAERAPPPYPVRENGTRWVGRNSTEPDGLVSSPPPHARLTSRPPRAGLRAPRRQRVVIVSREDRSLTVPGADSALSLNDGSTP